MKFGWIALLVGLVITAGCQPKPVDLPGQTPAPTALSTDMPEPTHTPVPCVETRGRFEFHKFQTTVMTHPLEFRVYLPPCYDFDPERQYPTLYLLHGQSFNDDQWDRLGADETLDAMVGAGETDGFILVMPRESNYMIDQWTSKFGQAIGEELVPWIDEYYRTRPEREWRAIGGISRGAGWAMRIGLIHAQTFGAIGGHSLAPFRGDFNAAPFWFAEIPPDQKPRIWIDAGDRDFMHDPARVFANRLEDYDMPYEWHVYPGAHTETYWGEHIADYLNWYAASWVD